MSQRAVQTSIEEIAEMLSAKRYQKPGIVLLLGSRAGALFGNEYLYETLQKFSLSNFHELSNDGKFKDCSDVLSKYFSESEKRDILVGALGPLRYREEDRQLAGLVKAEFFTGVLSTNIDTLLEDAYSFWGMQAVYDYQLLIAGKNDEPETALAGVNACYLAKVYGDLDSLCYDETGKMQAAPALQAWLQTQLSREMLILGYDPVWDSSLGKIIPQTGGVLWYVNEAALPEENRLAAVLEQRQGKYLLGTLGGSSNFLQALYELLGDEVRLGEGAMLPSTERVHPAAQGKRTAFISYSRQDKKYLERLRVHLKGYLHDEVLNETKIRPDSAWQHEIERELTQAGVVVVLVSSSYLASYDIHNYELPFIQQAAESGQVKLLPIILDVSPQSFAQDHREPLYQYQTVNSVSVPLKWMKADEQDRVWAKVAKQVFDILSSQT